MILEEEVKRKLRLRGFTDKQILNNRGLISATIEDVILLQNLTIPVVIPQLLCIEKSYYVDLTTMKKYDLIEELTDHYVIIDDGGNKCAYKRKLFRICAQ